MGRRIVVDTNVLVAGLRSNVGASFKLLSQVGAGRFEIAISVALLFEYEDTLKNPRTRIPLHSTAIDDVLDFLCAAAKHVEIGFLWRPTLPDPSDDLVLEVAINGVCDTILTFNSRDFRGAERFGVRVMTPAGFLASLEVE